MSGLFDLIREMRSPFDMVALICLFFAISGAVTAVVTQIRKYASHRQELDFKREMLDRGMSTDEIAEVISAAPPQKEGVGSWLASCSKHE